MNAIYSYYKNQRNFQQSVIRIGKKRIIPTPIVPATFIS